MVAHAHIELHRAPGWTRGLTFVQLGKLDPAGMMPTVRQFTGDAARRFTWLKAVITKAIVDLDVLDVAQAAERKQTVQLVKKRWKPHPLGAVLALMTVEEALAAAWEKQYAFPRSSQKVDAFMKWLDDMEQKSVLEISRRPGAARGMEEAWSDTYVHHAYQKGVADGRAELRKAGYNVPRFAPDADQDVAIAMNQPIHADRLGLAFTRSFTDLKGITNAMDTQISRALAEGLAAGLGPRQIAGNIVDRVDKIGLTRAKTLARTEVMRAHHSANMGEYRQAQAMGIKLVAEWETGATPCDICSGLATKRVWQIDDIENMIPVHPNCMCVAVPLPADFASKEIADSVPGAHGYLPDCASIMHDVLPPRLLAANALDVLVAQAACLTPQDRGRVERATKMYHPATAALQRKAIANEKLLVQHLKRAKVNAVWKEDNEPYDVWVMQRGRTGIPRHLIEVKTKAEATGQTANQITMRKECRLRKITEWEKYKAEGTANHTVLFDERRAATKIYYREGVGNYWIDDMQQVSWKELETLFKTGVGPDTVKGAHGYLAKCILRTLTSEADLIALSALPCITDDDIARVAEALKKYPPRLSNIPYMKALIKEGASENTILRLFTQRYAAEGVTDAKFIAQRVKIYKKIALKEMAKYGDDVVPPARLGHPTKVEPTAGVEPAPTSTFDRSSDPKLRAIKEATVKSREDLGTSGINASYKLIMTDSEGNFVKVVFKPVKGEKWTSWGGPVRGQITNKKLTYADREEMASVLNDAMGFDFVPTTTVTKKVVQGKKVTGSAQDMLENSKTAAEFGDYAHKLKEDDAFYATAFDYLIGNTDRHGANFMFSRAPNFQTVKLIDNGLSFPQSGVSRHGTAHNGKAGYWASYNRSKIATYLNRSDIKPVLVADLKERLDRVDLNVFRRLYPKMSDKEFTALKYRKENLLRALDGKGDSPSRTGNADVYTLLHEVLTSSSF